MPARSLVSLGYSPADRERPADAVVAVEHHRVRALDRSGVPVRAAAVEDQPEAVAAVGHERIVDAGLHRRRVSARRAASSPAS